MIRFGICFSRDFEGKNPLGHIGRKLPVYIRLLEFCQNQGWEVYVLTKKTYHADGTFQGVWFFNKGKFARLKRSIKIDLVYDRTGGVSFPQDGDTLKVINNRDFKILCWDKWVSFQEISKFMPKTFWVGGQSGLYDVLPKIETRYVVLKPFNGLKGIGVFIGPKNKALKFHLFGKNPKYIAQEFVDTRGGIVGITEGLHDLRVAIVNNKIVWSHVRVPAKGSYLANVACGGKLTEIDYAKVPTKVKNIVDEVKSRFFSKFNNPNYSLDFGIGKDGIPKIFEINDQIGFPTWEMRSRDLFLNELVKNFKRQINLGY